MTFDRFFLLLTCINPFTGLIDWFFSLKIWVPFSRLSFSLSLSQFVYIAYSFASTRSIYDFNPHSMAKEIFLNVCGTFVFGNFIFLLFEGPLLSIVKKYSGLKRHSEAVDDTAELNSKREIKND